MHTASAWKPLLLFVPLLITWGCTPKEDQQSGSGPNVIVIFCDDLGYADLSCYGATDIATPNLDQLAAEGIRFTNFYAGDSVCSPSRSALMTGCYPPRVGFTGNTHPGLSFGLHPDETTLAEIFKQANYATGIFGKWHLGHMDPLLPTEQGFDESLIIPYSHDMYTHAPWNPERTAQFPLDYIPLISNKETVRKLQGLDDYSELTSIFHDAAVEFVREHAGNNPFFIYLPHPMPHLEIKPPTHWMGKTERGPYGDVVAELDNAIGRLMDVLKETDVDENTLIVFSSDNGPANIYQKPTFPGGEVGPLSGRKGSYQEGGFRVPGIVRWPARIPSGIESDAMASTIDLLPTCASILGMPLPDSKIDGLDFSAFLMNPTRVSPPRDEFLYFKRGKLMAIRSGDWKLDPGKKKLFNLNNDPGELQDLYSKQPEMAEGLSRLAINRENEVLSNARPILDLAEAN